MEKLIEISEEEWENVNHFNKTILEEFLNDSTELSPKTKKVYRSNLRIWFVWVMKFLDNKKETMIKPLQEVPELADEPRGIFIGCEQQARGGKRFEQLH